VGQPGGRVGDKDGKEPVPMSSLFGPSVTYPMPSPAAPVTASGAKQAIKAVRQEARAARAAAAAAAPAPAMSVSTLGGYTTSYTMSNALRDVLDRLGSFLSQLIGTPAKPPKPPATGTPAPAPGSAKGDTDFVLSSFNVLGSSHTAPGGDKASWASGVERIRMVADVLKKNKMDVVGFQEMQDDQADAFKKVAGNDYALYPGSIKKAFGSDNSIAWRKDTWDLVDAQLLDMPSHKGRNQPSPLVRLRNKQTGQEVYFLNIHNAPGYHIGGAQQANRDRATALQTKLINDLKAKTNLPIVVTGDFNDKQKAFDVMTKQAGLHAANQAPGGKAPRLMTLDWIFGSKQVDFSSYTRLAKGIVGRITDHGVLTTKVHIEK
jgi:endonuclease/exonuclease/phosphatase family metal-dependent hydrolase